MAVFSAVTPSSSCLRDCLYKRHAPSHGNDTGLADVPFDGDTLAIVLLYEHRDGGILQIFCAEYFRQLLLDLARGLIAGDDLARERIVERARFGNLNGFRKIRYLEHRDLQHVPGANLVGFAIGVRHGCELGHLLQSLPLARVASLARIRGGRRTLELRCIGARGASLSRNGGRDKLRRAAGSLAN